MRNGTLVAQDELLGWYTYVRVHECMWIHALEIIYNTLPKQETFVGIGRVSFVEHLASASK